MNAKEALESLRLWANHQTWGNDRKEIIAALSSLAEENEKLKAEVEVKTAERLTAIQDANDLKRQLQKAEAELDAAIHRYAVAEDELSCANSKNVELKAELGAARPLLEAALGPCENRVTYAYRVNEASLAYRASKEAEARGKEPK